MKGQGFNENLAIYGTNCSQNFLPIEIPRLRDTPKCLLSRTAMLGQPLKDLILLRFHSMLGTKRRGPSNQFKATKMVVRKVAKGGSFAIKTDCSR